MALPQVLDLSLAIIPQALQVVKHLLPLGLFFLLPFIHLLLFPFDLDQLCSHSLQKRDSLAPLVFFFPRAILRSFQFGLELRHLQQLRSLG
jgi:hypothetical protein